MTADAAALGLVAGSGSLPRAIARAARRRGRRVTAIGLPGHTDPALEGEVAALWWHRPGELEAAVRTLRAARAAEAVLAGKFPKQGLLAEPASLGLDAAATRLLAALPDRGDTTLLAALAAHLEALGIRLLPQAQLVPELVAGEGVLGRVAPPAERQADLACGLRHARALARLDIGQTVVVRDGAVLAVEAIEGSDEAIRRAGRFAPGACAVKLARPDQDPRFDNPAVGPDTIAALAEARAALLAIEAGRTLILERERTLAAADAAGIAVLGVRP